MGLEIDRHMIFDIQKVTKTVGKSSEIGKEKTTDI